MEILEMDCGQERNGMERKGKEEKEYICAHDTPLARW
jgi:hypothetical protein